jgi:hypothetical protein
MGEICAIRMFGPSDCFQRSQFASSSIRVPRRLQSLATAPLVGPGSSMRRGKAPPSASMPKDRRGTCAWRVTPHLPCCCMTSLCAPQNCTTDTSEFEFSTRTRPGLDGAAFYTTPPAWFTTAPANSWRQRARHSLRRFGPASGELKGASDVTRGSSRCQGQTTGLNFHVKQP